MPRWCRVHFLLLLAQLEGRTRHALSVKITRPHGIRRSRNIDAEGGEDRVRGLTGGEREEKLSLLSLNQNPRFSPTENNSRVLMKTQTKRRGGRTKNHTNTQSKDPAAGEGQTPLNQSTLWHTNVPLFSIAIWCYTSLSLVLFMSRWCS